MFMVINLTTTFTVFYLFYSYHHPKSWAEKPSCSQLLRGIGRPPLAAVCQR